MSDVEQYIEKRTQWDVEFADGFEPGYTNFKIGVLLRQARESAGLTQEEVARRLCTKKSAISRIENHADDVRLSTLVRYAHAVGTNIQVRLARVREA
jgi:DNA-binding XRE family transcriptional regulator